jgi:uncharacterized phage infection (PIP) family protein YhgE
MRVPSLRPGLLPVIMLVVIVAWALFAVLALSGTMISTQRIQDRLRVINTVYPEINQNLKSVPLALETGRIAAQIKQAAVPLSPQLTEVVKDVGAIQTSVQSVLDRAGQINASAKTINTAVKSINAVVVPIGTTLASVDDKARSINNSVHGINDSFHHVRDDVYDIRDRVARINRQADTVIDQAHQIKDNTRRLVSPLLPGILQNSYAISRSPIVNPLDLSRLKLARLNPLLAALVPQAPTHLSTLSTLPELGGLAGLGKTGHSTTAQKSAPLLPGPLNLSNPLTGSSSHKSDNSPRSHDDDSPHLLTGLFGSS